VCFATERLKELNKLLEDVARTAISTGPRGAIRLAQGIEAVVSVGSEYLLQLYRVFFLCSLLLSLPHHLIP
jgi:aarF domain-containing kinase